VPAGLLSPAFAGSPEPALGRRKGVIWCLPLHEDTCIYRDGIVAAAAKAPVWPHGPRTSLSQGESSGRLGAATTAVAKGFGFPVTYEVNLFWDGATPPGTTSTGYQGSFGGLTFAVPAGASPGSHVVGAVAGKWLGMPRSQLSKHPAGTYAAPPADQNPVTAGPCVLRRVCPASPHAKYR